MNILWIFGSSWLVWFYVFPGILGDNCLILGTVDSYGHLIVSRLDIMTDGISSLSCLHHGVNKYEND